MTSRRVLLLAGVVVLASCGTTSLEEGLASQREHVLAAAGAVADGQRGTMTTLVGTGACYNDITGDGGEDDRIGSVEVQWATPNPADQVLEDLRRYWERSDAEVSERTTSGETAIQESAHGLLAMAIDGEVRISGAWGCAGVEDRQLLACDGSNQLPPCMIVEPVVFEAG